MNGRILWANMHLLFWLSLTPFVTSWMGDSHFASLPVAAYGAVLLLAGCAYFILPRALVAQHGKESTLARAVGKDRKGLVSVLLYAIAVPTALLESRLSCAIYVLVVLMWLIPDRRIEKILVEHEEVK